MEDPWVNAWNDPHKSPPESSSTKPQATAITWTSSSNFVTDDQTDIAAPAWEPEVGAIWDDSPDLDKDLWSRDNHTSQLWTTPTFDSIKFAKPSQESLSEQLPHIPARTPTPQEYDRVSPGLDDAQEDPPSHEVIDYVTPSHLTADAQSEPGEPASPSEIQEHSLALPDIVTEHEKPRTSSPENEGFGTFEVAVDDHLQSAAWTSSHQSSHHIGGAEEWAENWKESDGTMSEDNAEPLDEWELAKRQKEVQDRYVPPELLDSILHHFEEFVLDYWPEDSSEGSSAYQHCRDDLAETLNITSLVDRIIPSDLTLPIPMAFTKTFVSKEMNEALKLTRHHFITRNGPLAVYMNTKGSLSWEASVKSKPDMAEADVVPSGWRIVPKESTEQQQSANDAKKKASGGLLSFFGRNTTSSSVSSPPTRPSTPIGASPRSSVASLRPSTDNNMPVLPLSTKPAVSTSGKDENSMPSVTTSVVAEIFPTTKTEPQLESSKLEEPTQAPSAVSRFFNRFSRSHKSSTTNVRNSIALSSDDIEFLSDLVPSVQDEMDETNQLDAFSMAIRAPQVHTKLPPPLAPPPRAPPLPKPLSPPPLDPRPMGPASLGTRPSSTQPSIQNQLFSLDTDLTPSQPQSPASLFTIPPPRITAIPSIPPNLPTKLSPGTTLTQSFSIPSTQSHYPAFDEDEFSDFQTSPDTASGPLMTLDSAFGSSISSTPILPQHTAEQPTSFDDFDDFVSPPPLVPEKSDSLPKQTFSTTPAVHSIPLIPSDKSAPPTKQASLHERKLSRQADSHQRTLSLLESAAARGKWPAPPSPLPNAIPPPINHNAGAHLLDLTEEPSGASHDAGERNRVSLSTSTYSTPSPIPFPSPPGVPGINLPHPGRSETRAASGMGGTKSLPPPPTAPAISAPQIPPNPPMKPVPPLPPNQPHAQQTTQGLVGNLQLQQQLRTPSPPIAKPWASFTAPHTLGLGHDGNLSANGTRIGTPTLLPPPQQQQPATDTFSSLFSTAAPLAPRAAGIPQAQNTGASSGKLSAQDLSFFEGL